MATIEIYTKANCPYCNHAKALLDHKGASYTEIRVDQEPDKLQEMLNRSEGKRSIPQIFINDRSIGGFDDLRQLDENNELDPLLDA